MSSISITEIQQDPLGWLTRVKAGETLIVTAQNSPVAEIRPIACPPNGTRPSGLARGEFEVPDDFDAPLPHVLLDGKVVTRMPLDVSITRVEQEPKAIPPDAKKKAAR
jgi:antitoxin (DNA-binding transcriptional repressor) of toxin-antitoxin stability system